MCQKHKILMSNFEVFEISLGVGLLGMSPLPGLSGDFEADIKHIINWRPTCIVSLTETNEMKDLGAKDLFLRLEKEKFLQFIFQSKILEQLIIKENSSGSSYQRICVSKLKVEAGS